MGSDGSRTLPFIGRSVIREEFFDKRAATLFGGLKIADEALREVERVLSNTPLEQLMAYPSVDVPGDRKPYLLITEYQPVLDTLVIIFEIEMHSAEKIILRDIRSRGYKDDDNNAEAETE